MTKSRKMRWAGQVTRKVEMRVAYNIMVGKAEGKRPFGRSRRRWEENIGMDLREIGWESADWMHLAQDRDQWRTLVKTIMKFWFHKRRGIS
jgi:hypothetical protein